MISKKILFFGLLFFSILLAGCSNPQHKNTSSDIGQETETIESATERLKNTTLGIKFEYPQNRLIRQDTDFDRIFIENMEYKNYTLGNFPEDFLSMWIGYRKPSADISSYEDQIHALDQTSAKKEQPNSNFPTLFTYEFPYDPDSEKSYNGPYLQAIWTHNSFIFNAQTLQSNNRENNMLAVKTLQTILGSLQPTD